MLQVCPQSLQGVTEKHILDMAHILYWVTCTNIILLEPKWGPHPINKVWYSFSRCLFHCGIQINPHLNVIFITNMYTDVKKHVHKLQWYHWYIWDILQLLWTLTFKQAITLWQQVVKKCFISFCIQYYWHYSNNIWILSSNRRYIFRFCELNIKVWISVIISLLFKNN